MRGNIGRRGFLGTAAAGVGAAAMGMAGMSRAVGGDEPWEHKVYPTGNAELDVPAVRNAINNSRTVILMSTEYSEQGRGQRKAFDFGQHTIEIRRDVSIIGQDAMIYSDGTAFSLSGNARLTMRGVSFDNPTGNIPITISTGSPVISVAQLAIGGDEPWE